MIEAVGLTKRYPGTSVTAVDSLTLNVERGELFGFLGPNGAGKTTTIKMLVGLLAPTSGTARVAGFDIRTQSIEAKKRIGYIPDNPFLYEKLTGYEFLDFVADLYSIPNGQARRDEMDRLLHLLGLSQRAEQLIGGYSRGMRQKMAMAAALLHEPTVLFLDEPTVGLDPSSIRRLKDVLRELCRTKKTTVFLSTHTLEVAAEICDRVGIFHRGNLIALDSPTDLTSASSTGRLEEVFLEMTAQEADEDRPEVKPA